MSHLSLWMRSYRLCGHSKESYLGAPKEKNLAKYLKYHVLLSLIVSELFKGIFV